MQVRQKLMAVTSLHLLQFGFHSVPVAFNVLRVNTCDWILKMKGMIDNLMTGCIWQCADIVVCTPFITPDLSAGFGKLLDER